MLAVLTVSHSVANVFLDFITVEVGLKNTYFLGPSPGGVSTYALLGDQHASVAQNIPGSPGAHLLQQADSIAQGLSRFSIFPPEFVNTTGRREVASGLAIVEQSMLQAWWLANVSAQPFIERLDVQCQSPNETKYSFIDPYYANKTKYDMPNGTVHEIVLAEYNTSGEYTNVIGSWYTTVPVCDYEFPVYNKAIEKDIDDQGWKVLAWSYYGFGSKSEGVDSIPFGAHDAADQLRWYLDLSLNETALALSRGYAYSNREYDLGRDSSWQYGRKIRDGLTLAIGLIRDKGINDPYLLHADGVEFQVEYSVLVGPSGRNEKAPDDLPLPYYTVSSWSHSCPVADTAGKLTVATLPVRQDENTQSPSALSKASGCLIDLMIECNFRFPADNHTGTDKETPICIPGNMAVTLLSGIDVDPFMLAAYAGIATRNTAFGRFGTLKHWVALNSIAAAYIVTREVVPGIVGVDEVRASINPGFVCFMLLPLFFIVPLLCFKKNAIPPVPQSVWEVLVLGREEASVPQRPDHDAPFPPCPVSFKYGVISDASNGCNHLGLVDLAAPSTDPVNKQEPRHDKLSGQVMDPSLTQDPELPEQAMDPSQTQQDPTGAHSAEPSGVCPDSVVPSKKQHSYQCCDF